MKKTVIVTAIGSFSAQNVISACHAAGMRVVGCDIYPADWVVNSRDVDVFYKAPYATDRKQYRSFLKELCKKEQASVLMPLTDVEIDAIQQWRMEFAEDFQELGAEVWISDVFAITLCRNKEKMEASLRKQGLCRTIPGVKLSELEKKPEQKPEQKPGQGCRLDLPDAFLAENPASEEEPDADLAGLRYPLVAKPFDGRSSQGLRMLESEADLEFLLHTCSERQKQQYLVQPKISGYIITVDVVRNPETNQIFCLPRRELLRTLNGAGTSVCVFRNEFLEQQCRNIAEAVDIRGCVNMEFIEADQEKNEYYFLECNPRFAGGVAFSGAAGYDMAEAHIRCFTGEKLDEMSVTGEQYIARRYTEYSMSSQSKAAGAGQTDGPRNADSAGQMDAPRNADSAGQTDGPRDADSAGQTDGPRNADSAGQTDGPRNADSAGQTDGPRNADSAGQTDDQHNADAMRQAKGENDR